MVQIDTCCCSDPAIVRSPLWNQKHSNLLGLEVHIDMMLRGRKRRFTGFSARNVGKPWSASDLDDLKIELKRGEEALSGIAKVLGRDGSEVEAKLEELAIAKHQA